jgi:hypothetical protein
MKWRLQPATERPRQTHNPRRAILTALGLTLAIVVLPASASAAVRTATINDGLDMQDSSPGFMAAPVVTEPVSAFVSYDDTAGAITASVTFNTTIFRSMSLSLRSDCSDEQTSGDDPGPEPLVTLEGTTDEDTEQEVVELTRPGWRGSLRVPLQVSADGTTVSASFSDPNLRGLDARCVTGGQITDTGQLDTYEGYFAGFEPVVHTFLPIEAGMRLVEHPRKLYVSGTAGAPTHKGHLRWTGWGTSVARTQKVMIGVEYISPRQSIATGRYHYFRGYIRAYRVREVDSGRIYTRVRYVFDHRPPRKIGRARYFGSGSRPWNVEFCQDGTYPCNN